MSLLIGSVQSLLVLVLSVGALGLQAYALVDAARRPAPQFTAAGKLTKPAWVGILAVSTMFGLLSLPLGAPALQPFGFLNIIAVVAAGVYLADVRPALRGTGGGGGPYGGW